MRSALRRMLWARSASGITLASVFLSVSIVVFPLSPRSVDQHATIDVDDRSRDVGRQVGSEKGVDSRDIVGIAETTERNALKYLRLHLVGQLSSSDIGSDQTGRHAIDADAIRSELTGHRLCQTEDARLCGGVVWSAKNATATLGRDRRHACD